jgi:hypothetical protein
LSLVLDDRVKTIYYSRLLLIERHFFSGGPIVKSAHIVAASRPLTGWVALVYAGTMSSFGGCPSALHPNPTARRQRLDRDQDQVHPGEGSA